MKATILLTEGISLFELACATELFALPRPEFDDWYETEILSLSSSTRSAAGGALVSCKCVGRLPTSDLLIIPYFSVKEREINKVLAREVNAHYERGGRIISFCSGSFLLAHLGLLEGRQVTTHWQYADLFKERFPDLNYIEDILYCYDGQIGCSAGSASCIDLGIEVIRQDFGYQYANSVARRLVLPAHRQGGQSQYVEKSVTKFKNSMTEVMDWAVKNLSPNLTIDQIANKANMTRRTFDRRFKKTFNTTPLNWLTEQKLDVAKLLLETTSLTIEQVATKSGFDNALTLRHNFNKYLATAPGKYRQMFGNKLVLDDQKREAQ